MMHAPYCLIKDYPIDLQELALKRSMEANGHSKESALYFDINSAITWDRTPEGHSAWSKLYHTGDDTDIRLFNGLSSDGSGPGLTWQDKFKDKYMLGEIYYDPKNNYIFAAREFKDCGGDFLQVEGPLLLSASSSYDDYGAYMMSREDSKSIRIASKEDRMWFESCRSRGHYVSRHEGLRNPYDYDAHKHMMMGYDPISMGSLRTTDIGLSALERKIRDLDESGLTKELEEKPKDLTIESLLEPKEKSHRRAKKDEFKLQSHKKLDIF